MEAKRLVKSIEPGTRIKFVPAITSLPKTWHIYNGKQVFSTANTEEKAWRQALMKICVSSTTPIFIFTKSGNEVVVEDVDKEDATVKRVTTGKQMIVKLRALQFTGRYSPRD